MPHISFPLPLFASIMHEAPAQPATNLWRAVELTALIDQALPKAQACSRVLDLGCGDGGIMAILKPHLPAQAEIVGIDPDPAETRLALQRGVYADVITAGAEEMPFADAHFDVLISNSVLEHIAPLDDVLRESGRVLKTGGWLIATVPGPEFHGCLRGSWLPWVKREDYERMLDKRLMHYRYWTKDEWRQHLAQAGIDMEFVHDYLSLAVVRRWEFLSRITGGFLYQLVGRKRLPIALQRNLGLRRRFVLPRWFVKSLAWLLSCGLGSPSGPYGGLLVVGRKQ